MTIGLTRPVHIEDRIRYEWFDDAHQSTILLIDEQIFVLGLAEDEPKMKLLYMMEELPPQIILCKLSLDKEIVAIQISENAVIILDIAFRRKWTIHPRGEDAEILENGILWSDHSGSSQDLILVTTKGLELHKVSSKKGVCKLSRTINLPISYFWYNSDCRMVLTAAHKKPVKRIIGGSTPVMKDTLLIDGFFLNVEKPSMPSLELPAPERITRLELGPGVDSNRIYLVHIYGLLLCLVQYTTEDGDFITVYHVTKTIMEKMTTLSIGYSPQQILKISTYDNLILFHDVLKKVTIVFDIMKSPRKASGSTTGVIDPVIPPVTATFTFASRDELQIQGSSPSRMRAKTFSSSYSHPSVSHKYSLKFTGLGNSQQQVIMQLSPPTRKDFVEVENQLDAFQFYSPIIFQIHSSGWTYDCERRIMWKIECNPFHIAEKISDIREKMTFLYRRGKVLHWIADDAIPITASVAYESMMAAISILQAVHQALENSISDRELMSLFRIMHIPYWNEAQRVRLLTGNTSTSISRPGDSDLYEAFIVPVYKKIENPGSISSKMPKSPNSDGIPSQKVSLRSLRRPLRESLTRLRKSVSAVEVDLELPEPLELPGSSQSYLPDISVIGIKVRNIALNNFQNHRHNFSESSEEGTSLNMTNEEGSPVIEGVDFFGVRSPSPPIANMAFEPQPIAIRRDDNGDLLVNQHDMVAYVWLPLLTIESEQVPFAYIADCLSTYITTFAEMELEVISAVNILHAALLFYLGRIDELCNLLRNSFYNDSSELALTLLQFAGILDDELKSGDFVLKYAASLSNMPETVYQYHLPTWRNLLQRQGIDILWRRGEKCTVVKWWLTQGNIKEALALCLPKNDRWDDLLRPGSIPGSEFFVSAINTLKIQQSVELNDEEERWRKENNTQLFYNLHHFLTIWDPRCLLPADKQVSGVSPLCIIAPFPSKSFTEAADRELKRMFGYIK